MEQEMQELFEAVQTGSKFVRLPAERLLSFNDILAAKGFSVSRMEAVKTGGRHTGRRLEYDILANREYEDAWAIFLDPERSRLHVREIVDQAGREGGRFEFLVWAEEPPTDGR